MTEISCRQAVRVSRGKSHVTKYGHARPISSIYTMKWFKLLQKLNTTNLYTHIYLCLFNIFVYYKKKSSNCFQLFYIYIYIYISCKMTSGKERQHVVIVGGGYGGLTLAKLLIDQNLYDVTMVDMKEVMVHYVAALRCAVVKGFFDQYFYF